MISPSTMEEHGRSINSRVLCPCGLFVVIKINRVFLAASLAPPHLAARPTARPHRPCKHARPRCRALPLSRPPRPRWGRAAVGPRTELVATGSAGTAPHQPGGAHVEAAWAQGSMKRAEDAPGSSLGPDSPHAARPPALGPQLPSWHCPGSPHTGGLSPGGPGQLPGPHSAPRGQAP